MTLQGERHFKTATALPADQSEELRAEAVRAIDAAGQGQSLTQPSTQLERALLTFPKKNTSEQSRLQT